MNNKDALKEYEKMIINSWTYKKMTADEQIKLFETFEHIRTKDAFKGTFNQRWNVLQAIYGAFLAGLGYNNFNWRENEEKTF